MLNLNVKFLLRRDKRKKTTKSLLSKDYIAIFQRIIHIRPFLVGQLHVHSHKFLFHVIIRNITFPIY